jgi:hypothetical protein
MPSIDSLEVVVFSFNRGPHLLNCVRSVQAFMPGVALTVYDDASTDPQTRAILEDMTRNGTGKVLVAVSSENPGLLSRLNGGLYQNMQSFLDSHACTRWVLFLQDDTQIVRGFTARDVEIIDGIFSSYPGAAFIYPAFLANRSACTRGYVDFDSLKGDEASFSFQYRYEYSGYFDVCLAHVDRLRNAQWCFGNELESSLAALGQFGTMRLMRQPFVAHLPAPPTYRYRSKTFFQRVWEHYRAGLYPIDPMSDADVQRLFSLRGDYPTADHFLTSSTYWGSHPWPYTKYEKSPCWVWIIDRIERGYARILRRTRGSATPAIPNAD